MINQPDEPVLLQANFQLQQQEKESTARSLRAQIHSLHDRLQSVGESEVRHQGAGWRGSG